MRDTRSAIIQTSNDLFYREGFVAVSIEELLAASGLSRGTFYKHFRGKHDVALATLAHRAALFEAEIGRALVGAAGVYALIEALFDALAAWHAAQGARGCLFQTAASEYGRRHPDVFRLARDHKVRVRGLVEAGLARVGVRETRRGAEQLLLLLEGAVALGQFGDQQREIAAAKEAALALEY